MKAIAIILSCLFLVSCKTTTYDLGTIESVEIRGEVGIIYSTNGYCTIKEYQYRGGGEEPSSEIIKNGDIITYIEKEGNSNYVVIAGVRYAVVDIRIKNESKPIEVKEKSNEDYKVDTVPALSNDDF